MLPGRKDRWQRDPRAGMLVIVAGIALAGFVLLAVALMLAPAFVRLDIAASAAIRSITLPGLVAFAIVMTDIGNFWPMFGLTVIAGALLYARGRRTSALTLLLTQLSGTLFGELMKVVFGRLRPALSVARIPIPRSYSFPSGHALSSLLLFGMLAILVLLHEKRLRRSLFAAGLCLLVPIAIGLSRVYLGVHFLGDVLGSWFLGTGWLALAVIVSARWGAGSEDQADLSARAPAER